MVLPVNIGNISNKLLHHFQGLKNLHLVHTDHTSKLHTLDIPVGQWFCFAIFFLLALRGISRISVSDYKLAL